MSVKDGDTRIRKPTEAGASYQIELKTKKRDKLIKKIRKIMSFIVELKYADENCDTVSDELFSISDIFKEIVVVSNELRTYLSDDDCQQDEELIDRFEEEVFDFKTQTHVWLAQARKNQEEKSTSSRGSRGSRRSRTSNNDEKYLRQNDQNLPLPEDNPMHLPTSPTQSDATALLIAKLLMQQSAPEVSIDTFKGDPLEYHYFIATFKEAIESKIEDNRGRLTRLIKYVDGEPKQLIKHCIHEPPSVGYYHAIELLKERYGDPYRIIACYRKELQSIDQLKAGDAAGFRYLYSKLLKYKSIITPETYGNELNSPDLIRCLQSKLPMYLQDKWNRRAFDIRTKKSRPAIFDDFVTFVKDECALANDPMYSRQALNDNKEAKSYRPNDTDRRRVGGLKVHVVKEVCLHCSESHHISSCRKFRDLTIDERRKQLFKFRVCFYCYKKDHQARSCGSKKPCDICKGNHPTALHENRTNDGKKKFEAEENVISSGCTNSSTQFSSLSIVPVKLHHIGDKSKVITTFALLDNCSQGSFIKESVLKELSTYGEKTTITIKTMNGEETEESTIVTGLVASSYFDVNGTDVSLPRLYSRPSLPADRSDVPSKSALNEWNYLNDIKKFILSEEEKLESIGLLIGTNCPKALEPKEVIPSQNGGPFAVLTNLGWSITGPITHQATESNFWCNFVSIENSSSQIIVPNKIDDILVRRLISSIYETDFNEPQLLLQSPVTTSKDVTLSQEDRQFLNIMDRSVQMKDGHYVLPLPFRDDDINLPNNRCAAVQRATYLKKRFSRDPVYFTDYRNFMNELITKGYAKKSSTRVTNGKCWYIPHHGVYHPRKPGKIRVVFDCSATFKNRTLNSSLLPGPDLTNLLIGVFTRFRKENIAVIADIEKMFYQVQVPEEQQNFLRFVWWSDGDVSQPLEDYQMCVHLFGGASSPACSNYALKTTATENEKEFGEEAAETLRKDFYVDDMLKSVENEKKAISIVKKVKAMCAKGGFNLTKFVSNSKEVLHELKADVLENDLKVEITKNNLQPERALGIYWCIQNDTLGFRIELKDKPLTRRGILSTVSSIYDPIGLAAPYLLSGKRLLQELCCDKKGWDDDISDEQRVSWEKWRLHLPDLEKIEVRRCFKPDKFGEVIDVSIHHFSDASTVGLGQASYIRLVNNNGMIHTTLLMGKSRVTPLRPVSIPRLELTAAVLSTKVSTMLRRELDIPDVKERFWTDSQVVLAYLKNEKKRFQVFVANRIQLIRENTDLDKWSYVTSVENPADDASRGLSTKEIEKNKRWFDGPSFLRQPLIEQTQQHYVIPESDPELKKVLTVTTKTLCENEILDVMESHCSSWLKMKGLVFIILKWKYKWPEETVENLQYVEKVIIRLIQLRAFGDDFKKLKNRQTEDSNDKSLLRSCKLHRLDPFIDEDEMIRVGGRLKNSADDFHVKHPIILPRRCATTNLIILHYHKVIEHQGRNSTLNEIRAAGFWVVNGNSLIRYLIEKCVRCRYLRGKMMFQKMADLPYDRVNEAPPFTYCAVDMFGPFNIKIGRKVYKRYGMLFTCLSSRAVHIEGVHSMDADSFILALRRLIARRGNIRLMRSDNGSNFIGADRELRDAIREMDESKVKEFLLHKGCDFVFDWKRNPPTASNFGGVWERLIRSTRSILNNMLKSNGQLLDDESFVTFLTEAESIINSRPLSTETINDPDSPRPLTPNHLLTMKSEVILPPPGNFTVNDMYCRKRWRRVQHLLNEFWNRWKKEYLSSLQQRSKWSKPKRKLNVGDIVLVNNYTQRNEWPMGLIVETLPGKDGYVRKAKVRFNNEIYERPIQKLVLLLENV